MNQKQIKQLEANLWGSADNLSANSKLTEAEYKDPFCLQEAWDMCMNYTVPMLPLKQDIETKAVLKKCAKAHQALAELKGIVATIPNEHILISTLSLQEAKDSSAIENIITTHDELFKSNPIAEQFASLAAKEVFNYATALQDGFKLVKQRELLTANDIHHHFV